MSAPGWLRNHRLLKARRRRNSAGGDRINKGLRFATRRTSREPPVRRFADFGRSSLDAAPSVQNVFARGACRVRACGKRRGCARAKREPRAYSNAPMGVNFLLAGPYYTRGGLSFDTSLPVTDPRAQDLQRGAGLRAGAGPVGQVGKVRRHRAVHLAVGNGVLPRRRGRRTRPVSGRSAPARA